MSNLSIFPTCRWQFDVSNFSGALFSLSGCFQPSVVAKISARDR
jgi:hypothetical protein